MDYIYIYSSIAPRVHCELNIHIDESRGTMCIISIDPRVTQHATAHRTMTMLHIMYTRDAPRRAALSPYRDDADRERSPPPRLVRPPTHSSCYDDDNLLFRFVDGWVDGWWEARWQHRVGCSVRRLDGVFFLCDISLPPPTTPHPPFGDVPLTPLPPITRR
jgi:hypothetical protein